MIKYYFYLSLIILFFANCSSGSSQNNYVQSPKWYLLTPNNTDEFLYGSGEGSNKQNAIDNSLQNMSTRLVVDISSAVQTKTISNTNNNYQKETIRNVKVEAEKIRFNNYKIDNIENINKNYFVLSKVNRKELFQLKLDEFKLKDTNINTSYTTLKTKSKLEQIFKLEDMKNNLINGKHQAFVLYAINNKFNYKTFVKKYDKYINEIETLKSSVLVFVKSNEKDGFFKNEISDALNKNNYKISVNNDVQINLHNKIIHSKYKDWFITKVSTTITTTTNNKTLGNKIINSLGRSSSNKENALQSASKNFSKKIKQIGINNILFSK